MTDTKHLQLHRNTWVIRKRIPEYARHITGGSMFFTKSLQTSCIRTARVRRDILLADLHTKIEACEQNTERANYLWRLSTLQNDANFENARAVADSIEYGNPRYTEADVRAANTFLSGIQYPEYGYSLKDGMRVYKAAKTKIIKTAKDLGKIDLAVSSFLFTHGKKDIPLADITRKQVKLWLNELDKSGKTKKNYLTFLRGIWNHAVDLEEIPEGNNPFDKHNVSTSDTQNYQLYTNKELLDIFADVRTQTKITYRLIPMMGLVTGCRLEELCQLRSEDVRVEDGVPYIHIRKGKTKAAQRDVPLHPWVAEEVQQQAKKTKGDYLFPSLPTRENGTRSDSMSKWYGRLKRKHGVTTRDKAFHSLRVHMATALERGEVPEETATFILGHERNFSMSYGTYSKGKTIKQLYEAVVAAKFPDGVLELP